MERARKVKQKNKILPLILRILYNILVILCVLLIAVIVMQRLTDSNRSLKGYKIFKVVSGSMIPEYDIGEVVISKDTPVEDIKLGDDIVYRGKIGSLKDRIVMHKVVDIHRNENNELEFYAKGLNNSQGDPEISPNQILGVVKLKSVTLALLYKLSTSIYSSFIIITVLVVNVFISFKSERIEELPSGKKNNKKTNKELEEDKLIDDKEISNDDKEISNDEEDILEENVENIENNPNVDKKIEEKSEELEQNEKEELKNKKNENEVSIDNIKEEEKKNVSNKKNETVKKDEKITVAVKKQTIKKAKEEKSVIDTETESDKIEIVENSNKPKKKTKKVAEKNDKKETEKIVKNKKSTNSKTK